MRKSQAGDFLVVGKKSSAVDAYLRIDLLGVEGKLIHAMYRMSIKKGGHYPDLFDYITAILEPANMGNTYFIREFNTLHTFKNIPKNYDSFLRANQWLVVLQKNAPWIENPGYLFELSCKILDAWNEEKESHTVFLKALYIIAEKEGYGVKQAWLNHLPETLKTIANAIIFQNAPSQQDCDAQYITSAKQLAESLLSWIQSNTDIYVN